MVQFKHATLAAAGLIGLAGLAAPAFASQIYVDNVAANPGLGAYPQSDVTVSGTVDGSTVGPESEYAVQVVLTVNPGTSANISTEYDLATWCVDLFHTIGVGSSGEMYNLGALGTDNSLNPTTLSSTQIQEIGDLVAYGNNQMQGLIGTTAAQTAAIVQAAIWTVEYNNPSAVPVGGGTPYDNTLTVTSNGNYFSQGDITTAISAAETYGGSGGQLVELNGAQGLAYSVPAPLIGNGLPAVLAVGGVLFGARFLSRSKKRRWLGTAAAQAAG